MRYSLHENLKYKYLLSIHTLNMFNLLKKKINQLTNLKYVYALQIIFYEDFGNDRQEKQNIFI